MLQARSQALSVGILQRPTRPNPKLVKALTPPNEVCGALAIEVAGKPVSTSFIGAMASAAVFGECHRAQIRVLGWPRAFHKGQRHEEIFLSPRNMADSDFIRSEETYLPSVMAEAGFAEVAARLSK